MFRFGDPNIMRVDGDDQPVRIASTERTDTTQITDAEVKAASIAAARELAMTPYTELTPEERKAMTQAEKTAYLKAARDEKNAIDAEERAASNPMFDFTNRPDAPASTDGSFINYYSWQGDTNSGSWKLYRAANTPENLVKYGSRAIGGATQAEPGNPSGANALAVQPQPIKDAYGNITGWTVPGDGSTTDATTTTATTTTPATTTTTTTTASTTATTTRPTTTTATTTTATTTVPTGLDAQTTALIKSLQDQIANLTKQVTNTSTTTALEERQRKDNALASLTSRFSKYGLESLIPKIKDLVIKGSTESTIALELAETEEYKQRFKANTERLKKGTISSRPRYLHWFRGFLSPSITSIWIKTV